MKTPENFKKIEKILEVLGYWPCFHNGEVISFSAERELPFRSGSTVARLAIHVCEHKPVEKGTTGHDIITTKSILIRFLFHGACDFNLTNFNHQNVIDSIGVVPIETKDTAGLQVEIESIWGFGGRFRCGSVEIEAVEVLPINDIF